MSITPTRLQVGTSQDDAYALINNNFENVVQDIRDLGANISTTGTFTLTIPATSLTAFVFTLTSQGLTSNSVHQVFTQRPVAAVSGIAPQLDMYIDNDNDINYLFLSGSSLTNAQMNVLVTVGVTTTGYTNSLGAWVVQINNRDASPHTYYCHTRCGYFPTGQTGIFR